VDNLHLTNPDDEKWMKQALDLAEQAALQGEVPVGAVAVRDGLVIGKGFNRKEANQDPSAHAEMMALRQATDFLKNWRLIGVTLYSTLEPCPMCAGMMIQGRLERLVYGAKDLRFGADGTVINVLNEPGFNHQVMVRSGILEEKSAALLQAFFKELRASA
jgi:tRNA(adenine34) deaminase